MSERLYYRDSFLRDFEARVISCERVQSKGAESECARWWVSLEHTAFYPTSGGQPHDTGRLDGATVVDVFEREDGQIVHVTDREVALGPVRASIDWPRRFDHMQQHSGSHVLSAAFIALFNIPPVSFHMGRTISTIDVAASSISTEQLENIERFVNEIIFEDRPIHVRYGTGADLATLGVRKESERAGILRAVEIQGVDIQACGGTHVARTGQIGMILVRRVKKVRENWRVEFVCGQRARRVARGDFALLEDISQRLTCGPETINAGITRILNERNTAIRSGQRYLDQAAGLQAQLLVNKERAERPAQPPRTVTGVLAEGDMEFLRSVATNIISEPGVVALLASEANGSIVMAKSEGVPIDMTALLRESVASCKGKGGGTREFAQGSAPEGTDLHRVLKFAADRITQPMPSLHVVGRTARRR
ncbi:MAG TPA: DHHA1 domain-containing protein [Candidatus Acidoferrales bacterium]|nr:DHHA1 domain-containing protein [Candidatus Acidoferrales bacterium]